ncbi:dynein light chain Tctex-type 5-A [Osmerus mordax]|uniref:dynein light chain Tctex-type 5-A n=1 Tax=Osmerus mordax TaxID=8014 RepID=UPI00350ED1AB
MSNQQPALSQEVLAQFNQTTESWGSPRRRQGSISTLRSSQSQPRDRKGPCHLPMPLRAHPGGVGGSGTPRGSNVSNPNSPFFRRESGALSKRFSFGWLQGGRSSFSGLTLHQYPAVQEEVKLESTYRTGPDQDSRFKAAPIQNLLQATLDSYMEGVCYSPTAGSHLGQVLAEMLRGKVKEVCPPRYKIVCQVVIGQNGNHGVRVVSRCLWDPLLDDFAVATFQNASLFVLAIVHGVYRE